MKYFTMLMNIPMETLLRYASLGGFGCVAVATTYQFQVSSKVKNAQYFKDAMSLLNEHKAADALLGKPIKAGYIDVFSKKNFANADKADLLVPLKGAKANGELYFSAVKSGDSWLIKRVELEIKDNLGGRLLIYNDKDTDLK